MKTPNDSLTPRANIQPDQTVAENVLRYPQLREQLEQLGVDYCCSGKRSLADAVQRAHLDLAEVVRGRDRFDITVVRDGQAQIKVAPPRRSATEE